MHRREASVREQTGHGDRSSDAGDCSCQVSHHRDTALSNGLYTDQSESVAAIAKAIPAMQPTEPKIPQNLQNLKLLYTPEERIRRDATKWTLVQGILAPVQFLVFLVSLGLVLNYLFVGTGFDAATYSIVVKTMVLYAIMITGSIWEREVFGVYLFANAFFWEDVFSFLVLVLHTAYLVMLLAGLGTPQQQMMVALAAYATYLVNATQFVLKLRAARRDERIAAMAAPSMSGGRA